jgi:bifunctional NMN adenylyltransferase/nudix hydrolase
MNDNVMETKYDIAIVVGRFQPYHNTHHRLMQHALTLGKKVIVLLGSARTAPDVKNPFTPQDREKMIRACFDEQSNLRLKFYGIRDYPYHENVWITQVQNIVRNEQESMIDLPVEQDSMHNIELRKIKVCLVGHFKDETSYYLKLFPQWVFESFNANDKEAGIINATDIRAMYLAYDGDTQFRMEIGQTRNVSLSTARKRTWESLVPTPIANFLKGFSETETYKNLAKEYAYIQKYKEDTKFVGVSFPTIFVTTDCVVTAKGHLLVVKRGANPGKGLLALPGGFLEPNLTLKDNALKELKEETRIHVPMPILESSIVNQHEFDYPKRSLRGRTVTFAYHIELNPKMEDGLPNVKGGDDASGAFWMPIAEVMECADKFFEDHYHIVKYFLGVV